MRIINRWYSPPLAGDTALAGATWFGDDGQQCVGQALILDGALVYEHIAQWPMDVLEAVVAIVPDWQMDEKWEDIDYEC
jgi:hypothetical protein